MDFSLAAIAHIATADDRAKWDVSWFLHAKMFSQVALQIARVAHDYD